MDGICVDGDKGFYEGDIMLTYCYENGNGVLKMICINSKNKNNRLLYMINE